MTKGKLLLLRWWKARQNLKSWIKMKRLAKQVKADGRITEEQAKAYNEYYKTKRTSQTVHSMIRPLLC